jgi:hypothetical protein
MVRLHTENDSINTRRPGMVFLSFLLIQMIPLVVSPYSGLDHIRFTLTNARQAASYYCTRFGFKHLAYL